MKPIYSLLLSLCASVMCLQLPAQSTSTDSTGLPGEQFSLQAALDLFKKAASPEEFEKLINSEDQHVNNLDLNGDGQTDYIRVIDKMEKDLHVFVLQVPVSDSESQDIAVIELEKTGNETAILQIIGDEDIYGEQIIVEPSDEDSNGESHEGEMKKGGGPLPYFDENNMGIVVNVWLWPCVRFVYAPVYHPWISPWRWAVYPAWWRPWRPLRWHVWHPFYFRPRPGFAVVSTHRVVRAHRIYTPHRVTSVTVRTRHAAPVKNYKVTRTKTTRVTTGPKGNTKVKTTRTTTRVKRR